MFLKSVGMVEGEKKKCVASCWQQLLFAKGCHHLQNLLFVRRLFYLPVLQAAFKISNPEKRSSEFLYFCEGTDTSAFKEFFPIIYGFFR